MSEPQPSGVTAARFAAGASLVAVAAMTATALEWSHERPDRRFGLGRPRDEITGLATATFPDGTKLVTVHQPIR